MLFYVIETTKDDLEWLDDATSSERVGMNYGPYLTSGEANQTMEDLAILAGVPYDLLTVRGYVRESDVPQPGDKIIFRHN